MSDRPWRERMACRSACLDSKAWAGTNRRLRQAMVDGAMQRLEDIDACPDRKFLYDGSDSINERTWRLEALEGARKRAETCGVAFIWITLALKLFEWFILPKILEWWKNR